MYDYVSKFTIDKTQRSENIVNKANEESLSFKTCTDSHCDSQTTNLFIYKFITEIDIIEQHIGALQEESKEILGYQLAPYKNASLLRAVTSSRDFLWQ